VKARRISNLSGTSAACESPLRTLSAAEKAQLPPVLAGFDGFVDTILHVVWQSILERLSVDQLAELVANAGLVGFMN
jgi:hypothetical protein